MPTVTGTREPLVGTHPSATPTEMTPLLRMLYAHAFLAQAYAWAGLLHDALAATEVALGNAAQVDAYDQEFIGFNIELWVYSIRSRLLARCGRFDEARVCLEAMVELEARSVDLPLPGMTQMGFIELAWATDAGSAAREHAKQLRVWSAACNARGWSSMWSPIS